MKYLLFLFIFCSQASYSQQFTTKWSEAERTKGRIAYFLPREEGEFFALRWVGGEILGSFQASLHRDFKLITSGKIKMHADNSIANFVGARLIGDKFAVFLSDKREGKDHLYIQFYNDSIEAEGEAIVLASYDLDRERSKGVFDVLLSENENYFAVSWVVPGKKEGRDLYGFRIYDMELNLINEGEYPLPFPSRLSRIHMHHISNAGDYFMAVSEYEEDQDKGLFRDKLSYKALHIYHIAEDGLMDYTLDVQNRRVEAMAMTSDDQNVFTITGIYGEADEDGVSGVFYQKVDVLKNEKILEGFSDFDMEFITEGWSDKALERAEKRSENGKGDPKLYHYDVRDVKNMKDGSTVVTMEQYYIQVRSYPDSRGAQTSNSYYYYYNDIIAYKIDENGEFIWQDKIRKYQVSTNDGGPFSSYKSFVSENKIFFIFNDNTDNYNENGVYLDPEEVSAANYGKRKNATAIAEIDLNTGEKTRTTFFDKTELQALAVPKLFSINRRYNEIILYAVWGRKEKIGVLKILD